MAKLTLSFRGQALKVFHLDGDALVGRDPDCAIHIDSLAVCPHHARIRFEGIQALIEKLDESGEISVNHQDIESRALNHGDLIQLGKHTLTFSQDAIDLARPHAVGPPTAAATQPTTDDSRALPVESAPKASLQILNGRKVGRIIPLVRAIMTLGTPGKQCAMIALRNEGYFLSHLEGDSPSLVEGEPIGEESRLLKDGDVVQIGNIRMQFFSNN